MTAQSVPIISLASINWDHSLNDSPAALDVSKQLHNSFKEFGFAYIVDHPISSSIQAKLLASAKKFFNLPIKEKQAILMNNSQRAWRGYFSLGSELTNGLPDQKEGLYFGVNHPPNHPGVVAQWPMHGQNQYPEDIEFIECIEHYFSQQTALGYNMMRLVALGLGLEEDYFQKRFSDEATALFRIFNYPSLPPGERHQTWGVGEHTDMGFLTILAQDHNGGLEIKNRNNNWIEAPPVKNSFVLNIGDMLELWTRGIYRSTPHRVRNTKTTDRLSLPFFFDPHWQSSLEGIDRSLLRIEDLSEVINNPEERWDKRDLKLIAKNITYGEFVWEKIRKVFPHLDKDSS